MDVIESKVVRDRPEAVASMTAHWRTPPYRQRFPIDCHRRLRQMRASGRALHYDRASGLPLPRFTAQKMSVSISYPPCVLDLSPGELVRVRSAAEIFSTLDERGALDNMPFMPEMLRYCGQTHRVFKRADKTCDGAAGLHRMENTVHLSGLRCDGSAHSGCQLACLMYWKE